MENQEKTLIKQVQAGNTKAFDQLVSRHDKQILQIIYGILGNLDDAQDIYQDTFLKAFEKINSFRFQSKFSTWLIRIAINLSINFRKRKQLLKWLSFQTEKAEYHLEELLITNALKEHEEQMRANRPKSL